jgi:hypothetical protein
MDSPLRYLLASVPMAGSSAAIAKAGIYSREVSHILIHFNSCIIGATACLK